MMSEKEIKEKEVVMMMGGNSKNTVDVLDGSKITDLVHNDKVFNKFIDHKFEELDQNCDGKLSVEELGPAVADIGAALGLPAQGRSPDIDHIYDEVLNEFTHGKKDQEVNKAEFKEVMSDVLLGMAAGLKRDPIVILRIDGEDLHEFVTSKDFEPEAMAIFSETDSITNLEERQLAALSKLSVDQGMPPITDPWVQSNIIEPCLQAEDDLVIKSRSGTCTTAPASHASQIEFIGVFKKVLERLSKQLKEHPVIVAHSQNTFDGSGIKKVLSNKYELDKALEGAWKSLPKDKHGKMGRDYLRVALDVISPAVALPPYGAVQQMDGMIDGVIKMMKGDEGVYFLDQQVFNKLMIEVLGALMLQLEGNPITVSSNAVINEPASTSASTLFNSQQHHINGLY